MRALHISQRIRIARRGSRSRLEETLLRRRINVVHVSLSYSSLGFEVAELCHRLRLPVVATLHAATPSTAPASRWTPRPWAPTCGWPWACSSAPSDRPAPGAARVVERYSPARTVDALIDEYQ